MSSNSERAALIAAGSSGYGWVTGVKLAAGQVAGVPRLKTRHQLGPPSALLVDNYHVDGYRPTLDLGAHG